MKNSKAILLLIILLISILTGCTAELYEKDEIDAALYEKNEIDTDQYDPNTYKYSNDSRFKVVSIENIEDGTINGLTIIVLVDKKTKVMYMQTEKFQSGYGITLQVLLDAEGKPLLYDENLE